MRLFIEPTEPLLFRTGRSFDAGSSSYAETLFPPTPETLQGAVRAAIVTHMRPDKTLEDAFADPQVVNLIGNRDGYGQFRITGLALGQRTREGKLERLFPAPAHLLQVQSRDGTKEQIHLKPKKMDPITTDRPDDCYYLVPCSNSKEKLTPFNSWLTESGLLKFLRTREILTSEDVVSQESIYEREARLGIGMKNKTKTTDDGLLYQVQMIRMQKDYGFIVDIRLSKTTSKQLAYEPEELRGTEETQAELKTPKQGWLTLGGERRAARFEVESVPSSELEQRTSGNLLYLATPANFATGWQPQAWQAPLARPITAAVQRYQPIGGWLLNAKDSGGTHKTMRRCVAAGSVYFFDKEIRITRPFTEHGWQIGYGIAYIGEW